MYLKRIMVTLVWSSVPTVSLSNVAVQFFSSSASTSLLKEQKSQSSVLASTDDVLSTSKSIDNVLNVEKTKMSVADELSQALLTGILLRE